MPFLLIEERKKCRGVGSPGHVEEGRLTGVILSRILTSHQPAGSSQDDSSQVISSNAPLNFHQLEDNIHKCTTTIIKVKHTKYNFVHSLKRFQLKNLNLMPT